MPPSQMRRRLEAVEAKHTNAAPKIVMEFRPRGMNDADFAVWHAALTEANTGRQIIIVEFVSTVTKKQET